MYLFKVGNSLATKYVRTCREKEESNTQGLYNSFCNGFCEGIKSELQKNCTALMLTTPQEVVESFNKLSEKFRAANTSINTNDANAYNTGKIEGRRALNAQYIEGEVEDESSSN